MKDDIKEMQRLLEKATDAGNTPTDELDPETASLREAWLAFGQMLEAAPPPAFNSPLLPREEPKYSPYSALPFGQQPAHSPRPLGEGQAVRATKARAYRHWRFTAVALVAASLLIAAATAWMLHNVNGQAGSTALPDKIASNNRQFAPSKQIPTKTTAAADEPKWDDSLDEQFTRVGWQMLCIQQNQSFRTDAFGIVEYQLEQLSKSIQADSL